jgi:hypothetical protein
MIYKIIYTNKFIPSRFAARSIGPLILVRPKYTGDKGLIEHEKVHVKQYWLTLGLFGIPYNLFKKFRLICEVAAYKEQLKHYDTDKTQLFAYHLATLYNLDITQEKAVELLSK